MTLDPLVLLTVRYGLCGVFAVSAAAKLAKPRDFVGIVANYRVLPRWAVGPVAVAVPVLEAFVALGFATDAWPRVNGPVTWTLLAAFTGALAVNLVRGRTEIDCGCLGPLLRQRIGWWMVVRNGVLMGAVGLTYPGWVSASRAYGPTDAIFAGLAALVLLLLYATFQLLWTQTPGEMRSR